MHANANHAVFYIPNSFGTAMSRAKREETLLNGVFLLTESTYTAILLFIETKKMVF